MSSFPSSIGDIEKAYRVLAYRTTRVILTPVMEAIADSMSETIFVSVKKGVRDAFDPADILGGIFGRKN